MYLVGRGRGCLCTLKCIVFLCSRNVDSVYELYYLCTKKNYDTDDFDYVHANTLNDHSYCGFSLYMCKS